MSKNHMFIILLDEMTQKNMVMYMNNSVSVKKNKKQQQKK